MTEKPQADPKAFRSAYLQAHYHINQPELGFTFSQTPSSALPFAGRAFVILTAHNPYSHMLSEAENQRRGQALEEAIQALALDYGHCTGSDPNSDWREAGFVIWDAPLMVAVALAQQFEQNAIVYGTGNHIGLVWCLDFDLAQGEKANAAQIEWHWPRLL
jgi:hypothetical protein